MNSHDYYDLGQKSTFFCPRTPSYPNTVSHHELSTSFKSYESTPGTGCTYYTAKHKTWTIFYTSNTGLTPSHYAPNIFSPSSPVPVPFPNTTKPVKKLNLVYRETLHSNQHIIRHATQNTPSRSINRPLFVSRSFEPTTQTNTKTLVFGDTHNSFPHCEFHYQYYSFASLILSLCYHLHITFPAQHVLVPPFVVCLFSQLMSVSVLLCLSVSVYLLFFFSFCPIYQSHSKKNTVIPDTPSLLSPTVCV